jgi:hypothetical protein
VFALNHPTPAAIFSKGSVGQARRQTRLSVLEEFGQVRVSLPPKLGKTPRRSALLCLRRVSFGPLSVMLGG